MATTSSTPIGSQTITVTGSGGGVSKTTTITVQVLLKPVARLKMNETSGTIAADSAGTNPGTLKNGPLWTTAGKFGGALQFDGVNDSVRIAPASSLNDLGPMTV